MDFCFWWGAETLSKFSRQLGCSGWPGCGCLSCLSCIGRHQRSSLDFPIEICSFSSVIADERQSRNLRYEPSSLALSLSDIPNRARRSPQTVTEHRNRLGRFCVDTFLFAFRETATASSMDNAMATPKFLFRSGHGNWPALKLPCHRSTDQS